MQPPYFWFSKYTLLRLYQQNIYLFSFLIICSFHYFVVSWVILKMRNMILQSYRYIFQSSMSFFLLIFPKLKQFKNKTIHFQRYVQLSYFVSIFIQDLRLYFCKVSWEERESGKGLNNLKCCIQTLAFIFAVFSS